jgi:hypothetical protein
MTQFIVNHAQGAYYLAQVLATQPLNVSVYNRVWLFSHAGTSDIYERWWLVCHALDYA